MAGVEVGKIRRVADSLDEDEQQIELHVHAVPAPAIVIIYPGFNGSHDGYDGKYRQIAEQLAGERKAAVIRMENRPLLTLPYEEKLLLDLRLVLGWTMQRRKLLCGNPDASLYLLGVSAGAGAVAAVAADFPVNRMLLVAPADRAGEQVIEYGLRRYEGSLWVMVGDQDDLVGSEVLDWYRQRAVAAAAVKTALIRGCDHNFSGDRHQQLLSQQALSVFG